MDALVLREAGGPLTLEETPKPQPGPGECLIRVRACGLGLTLAWNRTDRVGTLPGRPQGRRPAVPVWRPCN